MQEREDKQPPQLPETHGTAENPMAYAAGDLVVLRSGGPMLTIASIGGAHAHCIWFSSEDALERAEIPLVCLDPADGSDLMMTDMDFNEMDIDGDIEDNIDDESHGRERKKKKKKKGS